MKNKKRTYIVVALLLAIVALGIGYASVTRMLTINGSATALPSDGVKLEFTGTPTTTGGQSGTTAAITSGNTKEASCTVVLKDYNESATCTYTVSNTSSDSTLSAKDVAIAVYESDGTTAWSASSSTYFTITSSISSSTIANGGSATATVTVTLKKENTTGSNVTETFKVYVSGDTQQS